jgi:hypothetical protein
MNTHDNRILREVKVELEQLKVLSKVLVEAAAWNGRSTDLLVICKAIQDQLGIANLGNHDSSQRLAGRVVPEIADSRSQSVNV